MTIDAKRWWLFALLSLLGCLCGCIDLEQRLRVHDDGSTSFKATIKIDPKYEALLLPQMKQDMPGKLPAGVRVDFSQRIDGKAAVVIEADGAASAELLRQDGSTTITISDGGMMKKRFEYRLIVPATPEIPFPHRGVVTLPGSLESVLGGKKTAGDTFEIDLTHAKRGDVFAATSTAFAFSVGGGDGRASAVAKTGAPAWLTPVSIGSICVGAALLLIGWLRARAGQQPVLGTAISASTVPRRVMEAPLETASLYCTECGTANATNRKFCGQCGHALDHP
jgi:hypothetical protein